jgi:hypothetical protein
MIGTRQATDFGLADGLAVSSMNRTPCFYKEEPVQFYSVLAGAQGCPFCGEEN